jgi:hypothetical protein
MYREISGAQSNQLVGLDPLTIYLSLSTPNYYLYTYIYI